MTIFLSIELVFESIFISLSNTFCTPKAYETSSFLDGDENKGYNLAKKDILKDKFLGPTGELFVMGWKPNKKNF